MSFEHIAPTLFSSSTHNRGRCRLDLDEACFMYDMIKKFKGLYKRSPKIIEIGTYKAGSTALMASAGGEVISIDNYCSSTFANGDQPLRDNIMFINSLYLSLNVQLIKADSTGYNNNDMLCDILFIDADHKYDSVKADYKHWIHTLKKGGHLLFHDSCGKDKGRIRNSEVPKFIPEVPYDVFQEVGSITHFIKE